MMHPSDDDISRLIMEKILGMTSPQDDALLQQLVNENPAVKTQYEETLNMMQRAAGNAILPPEPETSWQQIETLLTIRKTVRIKRTIRSVAAVIIFFLLISSAWIVLENAHRQNAAVAYGKALNLTLADGKMITLSGTQGSISINGAILTNDSSDKILNYQATGKLQEDVKVNTLSIPPGMDYKIALSDGTIIMLNSATELSFPFAFTGHTREISISGEAYLKVAHDATKPFIVHTPGSTVRVLGTQFNVNTYDKNSVKVSLVEGSLKFTTQKDSLILVPGKEGLLENQSIKEQDINEDDLSWINGEYIMNNTTVSDIAALIPRWFGVQIVLDNHNTADKRFTGIIYKNKPLKDFLEMLKGTTDANYYYTGDVLHLK